MFLVPTLERGHGVVTLCVGELIQRGAERLTWVPTLERGHEKA